MALLPFFGYLFGRFVTHTMEVRYVIAALIAFAATFGIVLERKLRSNTFYYATLTLIVTGAIAINAWNIVQERRDLQTQSLPASNSPPKPPPPSTKIPTSSSTSRASTTSSSTPTTIPIPPCARASLSSTASSRRSYWLHHDTTTSLP